MVAVIGAAPTKLSV